MASFFSFFMRKLFISNFQFKMTIWQVRSFYLIKFLSFSQEVEIKIQNKLSFREGRISNYQLLKLLWYNFSFILFFLMIWNSKLIILRLSIVSNSSPFIATYHLALKPFCYHMWLLALHLFDCQKSHLFCYTKNKRLHLYSILLHIHCL